MGFEGGASVGLLINPNLSIYGTVNYDTFAQAISDTFLNTSSVNNNLSQTVHLDQNSFEVLFGIKYRIGNEKIRPYLLGGVGVSDFSTSIHHTLTEAGENLDIEASNSSVCPAVAAGLGVEFPIGENTNFFFQTELNMIFTSAFSATVPVNFSNFPAGTTASNTSYSIAGGTVSYIPFQMGLDFNL
jgi:opacity protein-like surface antigen